MNEMTVQECTSMIESLGLSKYSRVFLDNAVDGPMLEAFTNAQFGKQLMISIGISEEDCLIIIPELYRLRARGFNNATSTATNQMENM